MSARCPLEPTCLWFYSRRRAVTSIDTKDPTSDRTNMAQARVQVRKRQSRLWSPDEDQLLVNYLARSGLGETWNDIAQNAGLKRCGKGCRLRWINYLEPSVKHGKFTAEEEAEIVRLHEMLGNRWSQIAASLPGRTDNQIKNYWNSKLRKKHLAKQSSAIPEAQTNAESSSSPAMDKAQTTAESSSSPAMDEAQTTAESSSNPAMDEAAASPFSSEYPCVCCICSSNCNLQEFLRSLEKYFDV